LTLASQLQVFDVPGGCRIKIVAAAFVTQISGSLTEPCKEATDVRSIEQRSPFAQDLQVDFGPLTEGNKGAKDAGSLATP
jgi:hypothetical protein